jgi:hypothetical protein
MYALTKAHRTNGNCARFWEEPQRDYRHASLVGGAARARAAVAPGLAPEPGRAMSITFALFWMTLGAFVVEVVLGKVGILTGGAVHPLLGEVPHFLLLAVASALLTAECLRRETQRARGQGGGDQAAGNGS